MATNRESLRLDLSGLDAVKSVARARSITLKGVKAGSKLVQAAVKARAPKRSGALGQSIGTKAVKGKRGRTVAFAVIGARVKFQKTIKRGRGKGTVAKPHKYAGIVNKGSRHSKGTHFLDNAFTSTRAQAAAAGMQAIRAELARTLAAAQAKLSQGA